MQSGIHGMGQGILAFGAIDQNLADAIVLADFNVRTGHELML